MKLKPLLPLILFAGSFVATAQQNNIPSEQQLYIDFNDSIGDNSLSGLSIANTNVSYEADRNANPLRAGKFGGCNQVSHLKVFDSNTHQMDFTTGGTISMWAKPDLNNSMNPADGSCNATGRHTFFLKGGDGFNTPPGFYAYTAINGNTQTIVFAASSNSGNFEDTFTLPYTDTWHHYAFVFTTTNLRVYVDGVLKRNVTINLNFTEANNQTLYIGTLGPKTSPVNGITYWFPFTGSMDEFRLFTKALTAVEVTDVFNESYDMIAPLVRSTAYIGGEDVRGYGFEESFSDGEIIEFNSNKIVVSATNTLVQFGGRNPSTYNSYVKLTSFNDNFEINWSKRIFQTTTSNVGSIITQPLKGSSETGVILYAGKKLYVVNNGDGNVIFEKEFTDFNVVSINEKGGFYYVVVGPRSIYRGPRDYQIQKLSSNGMTLQTIQLDNASIVDFDWNPDYGLLLTGTSKTYIVNIPSLSYSQLSTPGKTCKWVGNNFIISNDTHTYRIDQNFSYTLLASGLRSINILNNEEYLVHIPNEIKRYSSAHNLILTITTIADPITVLPFSNNLFTTNRQFNRLFDLSGNEIWSLENNFLIYFNVNIQETSNLDNFLMANSYNSALVHKVDLNGKLLWKKYLKSGYERDSFILSKHQTSAGEITGLFRSRGNSGTNALLHFIRLAPDNSPCLMDLKSDLKDNYCSTNATNPVNGYLNHYFDESIENLFYKQNHAIGWYRDNVKITSNSIIQNITQSGTYKLSVRQGICEKSIEKVVNISNVFNPPAPTIAASYNPICDGDTTNLIITNCSGSLEWNGIGWQDRNGNTARVYPSISTDYTANCYVANSQYGNCRSANSTPFTVNVITLPEVIGLAGNSPLNATYRAERINSQQNVIINGTIDYKSKNAIELNPGFSTQANAVFNAKIVNSCGE